MNTQERTYSNRLFYASCVALIVTGMTASIRAGLVPAFEKEFGLNQVEVGLILSAAFWGFPLASLFGGPLVDIFGMGRLLVMAFVGHLMAVVLTIFADGFTALFIATLLAGLANGLVEAACNPLVATIYNTEKTKMLNRFHMWFPGGLVIGGILSYLINQAGYGWEYQMGAIGVFTLIYGLMFFGKKFPVTERVAAGVSTGSMYKECLRPLFLFLILCMLLTASTEFATGQWIESLLKNAGVTPIILLVFINGIMMVGRLFAGPIVHRIAPSGILLVSAILAAIGLLWLSYANGGEAYAAAGVFALGICFFWPTMLGFVSENLPKTGAVGLSLMGGAGMFSLTLTLPVVGAIMQNAAQAAGGADVGAITLRYLAVLPGILIVLFAGLTVYMRGRKAEHIAPPTTATATASASY